MDASTAKEMRHVDRIVAEARRAADARALYARGPGNESPASAVGRAAGLAA
jgi:hypothetical protein